MNINLSIDSRLPMRLLLLIAAPVYLIIFLAGSAHAGYWSGSTPPGGQGGSCSFTSQWYTGNQWSDIKLFPNGCNGTIMNPGNTVPGGNPCAARGDVAQVFWLGEQPAGGSWLYYYEGGNSTEASWKAAVSARAYNSDIRAAAMRQSGTKTLVWVCNNEVNPDIQAEKPTTRCISGVNNLVVPTPASGSRYRQSGSTVGPGNYPIGSGWRTGSWRIGQEITRANAKWTDGTRADKVWTAADFGNRDCTIDINITLVHCTDNGNLRNTGYVRVNFAGNDEGDVQERLTRDPGADTADMVEGRNYPVNDAVTVTFTPTKEESGAGKKVITKLNGVVVSNKPSRTMKTCNKAPTMSARFNPVNPKRTDYCNPSTSRWERRVTPGSWTIAVAPASTAGYVSLSPGGSGTGMQDGSTVRPVATINGSAPNGTKFADAGGARSSANGALTQITWGNNANNTVFTFALTGTWSQTAGASCTAPTPGVTGRQVVYQNVLDHTDCFDGSYQSTEDNTNTRGPYDYAWTTVISNGGPSVGGSTIQTQADMKYTPLGVLLQQYAANNQDPGQAAIDQAIAQGASTDRARLDLNDANKEAIAKGGVMNVQELTTRVNLIVTKTDVYDNFYTDCTPVYNQQVSYRDITYSEILRWDRQTREQYATWEQNDKTADAYWTYEGRWAERWWGAKDAFGKDGRTRCNHGSGLDSNVENWGPQRTNISGNTRGQNNTNYGGNCKYHEAVGSGFATQVPAQWSGWYARRSANGNPTCATDTADRNIRYCNTGNYTAWTTGNIVFNSCSDSGALVQCVVQPSGWNYVCGPGNRGPVVSTPTRAEQNGPRPDPSIGQWIPANVCWTQWQTIGTFEGPTTRTNTGRTLAYSTFTTNIEEQTPEVTRFWQALANHCNAQGYNTALGARTNNIAINNNDGGKTWSGSAVTAPMTNTNSPVWGAGAIGAGTITNDEGFFDKQCSYNGVKSAESKQAPASALGANWTYFRDNEQHDLGVFLFEPASSGVVSYDGSPALRTLATRWIEGTPKPYGVQAGELFLRTDDGQDVWMKDETPPFVLKNWSTSESGAASTWGLVQGQHTVFKASADWPSDTNKPNVFQIKWEYDPNVANTVALTQVGFGPGGARAYTEGVVNARVQGWVMGASKGSTTPRIDPTAQANSSGTGTAANSLDNVLIEGLSVDAQNKWTQNPNNFSEYYYWLKFVRATGE